MPSSSGGFEQAYNAQAGVDVQTHLIVAQHVTQHTNDKQEVEPALEAIATLPKALGYAQNLLADTGYFSEANVQMSKKKSMILYWIPLADRAPRPSPTGSRRICWTVWPIDGKLRDYR